MKKLIPFFLTLIVAVSIFVACNDDNSSEGTHPIVGTWKLVERYSNGNSVVLSSCQMEETYIFGPEQFTHELYENGGKPGLTGKSTLGGDDDDDDDHHSGSSDDDDDDDHGSSDDDHTTPTDDTTDDTSDDDSDDDHGGGGSGTCVNSERTIGSWLASQNNFVFTVNSVNTIKNITFTDANTRFYVETTATVGGVEVITRYVYQKQ
jgi:hypothetical protein